MKSDPNMQLSKTWQIFEVQDLSTSCKIYGRSGMMRSGIAYRLPPLAHLTGGTGYGLLPHPACIGKVGLSVGKEETESTPGDGCKNATDPDCKQWGSRAYNKQRGYLPDKENRQHFETQQEWDIRESRTSQICKVLPDTDQQGLQGCRGFEEISPICSQEQIGMYYCSRGIKQWGKEPLALPRLKDDRLNPDWVEWLMGYPISWIDGGSRMQRLQSLGNAVVPLILEFLGAAIVSHRVC